MRKQKQTCLGMLCWVACLLQVQLRNSKVKMTSLELQHLTSTLYFFRNEAKRRSLLQKSIDTAKISGDRHAVHTVASVICASDQNLDEFAHLFEDTT